jgi:hypothetical protein
MRAILVALAVMYALTDSGRAAASPIIYSESITTNGVLDGTTFTDELVTLTFTADTANVTFIQGSNFTQYSNVPSVGTVTVAGVGSATLSDAMSLSFFAFPTFSEFSVTDTLLSTDVLDTFAVTSGFAGYTMVGPLSPVSGGASYTVGTLFGTDLGSFEFTKTGGGVSTVTATPVPEPSDLVPVAIGIVGLMALRRRHIPVRSRAFAFIPASLLVRRQSAIV